VAILIQTPRGQVRYQAQSPSMLGDGVEGQEHDS
jgi:hypothetical protein